MRYPTGSAVFCVLAWLAGCEAPPPSSAGGADAEFGGWSWDTLKPTDPAGGDLVVSAAWGSWKKKLAYVIVADINAAATTSIVASGERTRYDVRLTWPNGRSTQVLVETADGKAGTVSHAGRTCDLAQGAVFVILPKGDEFELRQLQRDISGETASVAAMAKLIRSDPELVRTFAKGNK